MLKFARATLQLNSLLKTASTLSPGSWTLLNRNPFPLSLDKSLSTVSEQMDLQSMVSLLESIAPSSTAEDWDNVGLLVEPLACQKVKHVFLTIDLTEPVMDEVLKYGKDEDNKVDLVVSYHPPIFKPFKRLTQSSVKERLILKSIESGIAIYSPHTAHDCLWGGVNDWILKAFDEGNIIPLSVTHSPNQYPFELCISSIPDRMSCQELVTQLSLNADNIVIAETCHDGATARSYSLKCPVKKQSVNSLLPKLMQDFPNYKLHINSSPKVPTIGAGRHLTFNQSCSLSTLVSQIKTHLNLKHVRLALPDNWGPEEERLVSSLAVCVGSGSSVLRGVKADVFLTGEMSHHDILEATSKGTAVLLCEHTNTERGFLQVFKQLIEARVPPTCSDLLVTISQVDRDPISIV